MVLLFVLLLLLQYYNNEDYNRYYYRDPMSDMYRAVATHILFTVFIEGA